MDVEDELRRLRARAYGPDADIADDAAALARLEELERRRRAAATADEVRVVVERGREPAAGDPRASEASPAEQSASPGVPGRQGRSRARTALVAVVLVAAIVLVAVAATAAVMRRTGYAAPVAAVLTPAPDREVPSIYGMTGDASTVFADFAGMTAFATDMAWTGGDACLLLAETARFDEASPDSFSGFAATGCGAGPFPATVTFIVGPDAPEATREVYPDGTALQFILEQDRVVVLAAPAASGSRAAAVG